MEISKEIAIDIFKKNFKYDVVDTILGQAIKMDYYNAFLYANVTGAGYLDNYVMPFTPKGLMKIFYNAFNYNFVTGIFDNASLKYSPYNLSLTRNYLFMEWVEKTPLIYKEIIEIYMKYQSYQKQLMMTSPLRRKK